MELISEELFKKYSPIKVDTDVADFTPYIDIAQILYINKLLGPALLAELETQIKAATKWPPTFSDMQFTDVRGRGGNDGQWGAVAVNPAPSKYEGRNVLSGDQCVMIGDGTTGGALIVLNSFNGIDVGASPKLLFKIGGAIPNNSTSFFIELSGEDGYYEELELSASAGKWTDFEVNLPFAGVINTVSIYCGSEERYYIDDVKLINNLPYPISDHNKALLLMIAPALSFYATYQGLPFHWASIVNKGVTIRESENSKGVGIKDIAQLRLWIKNDAEVLLKDLINYLCDCAVNYPLWTPGGYCGGCGCEGEIKKNNYDFGIYIPKRR